MDCSQYLRLGRVARCPRVLDGHLRPNTGDGEGQRTWKERARARSQRCTKGVSGGVPTETCGEVFPRRGTRGDPPQGTSLSEPSSFSVDSSSFT